MIDRVRKILTRGSDLRSHLLVQSSGTILAQLIPIVISPLLTRFFEPKDFGLYGTIVSISTILSIVIALRIDHGIMVAPTDEDAADAFWLSIVLAIVGAFCFSLFGFVALVVLNQVNELQLLIWCVFSPIAALTGSLIRSVTLLKNRMKAFPEVSRARVLQAIGVACASAGLGYLSFRSYGLIVGLLLGNVLYLALLSFGVARPSSFNQRTARRVLESNKKFLRYSLPADIVNTLSSRVPFFVFPALYGLEQTGYLTLAYRVIATPARFVGTAIGEVFYSHAARQYEISGTCWRSARRIAFLLAGLGAVGFGGLFLVARPLFQVAFGAEWLPAATFTQILIPMIIVSFVVSPLSVVFYITGRQKEDFLWQIAFLISTLGACLVGLLAGGVMGSLAALSAVGTTLYLVYLLLIRRFADSTA